MGAIISVRTRLKTILDALVATTTLAAVYNYQPIKPTKTPFAALLFGGGNENLVDSVANEFESEFLIRVVVEEITDYSTQETKLLTATDAILDEIRDDDNWTLSGDAHFLLSTSVSAILSSKLESTPVLYQEITVKAKTLKSTI